MQTRIKTDSELISMKASGKILATVLNYLSNNLSDGMSTKDIAILALKELRGLGGKPSFLNYQGFPDIICISINNEVVHGIPKKDKIIKNGDIVSLDFGVTYDGMITDGAISVILGKSDNKNAQELVKHTKQSLDAGINVLKDGVRVGDISSAVQAVLDNYRHGIVRDLVGHGVGHQLHEDPNIPNYGKKGSGPLLKSGMTIAIEPMATLGGDDVVFSEDGWTVLTSDGSLSAHFENTVLITDNGFEILTEY